MEWVKTLLFVKHDLIYVRRCTFKTCFLLVLRLIRDYGNFFDFIQAKTNSVFLTAIFQAMTEL
jgi:hypothetical protein